MNKFERKLVFGLIILLIVLTLLVLINLDAKDIACRKVGGTLSGNLNCRKGNEFYEIYPSHVLSVFDFTVNKYPKREQ